MSMFREVAAFELRYQLKSPVFWITFLIFALLPFFAVVSDSVQIGSGGNVLRNSPYAVAMTCMIMSVFAIFIMTAFVANVVSAVQASNRDVGARVAEPPNAAYARGAARILRTRFLGVQERRAAPIHPSESVTPRPLTFLG